MTDNTAVSEERPHGLSGVNMPIFLITGGFIILFCVMALVSLDSLSKAVDVGFAWSAKFFGLYWQLLLLATFFIGIILCFLPGSKAIMGGLEKPEFTKFQWGSMIMCTLLAGGGVFWAAGEPMAHFTSVPPLFAGIKANTAEAVPYALAQSYLHWGFLAWAILGALTTVMLMYYHYEKGLHWRREHCFIRCSRTRRSTGRSVQSPMRAALLPSLRALSVLSVSSDFRSVSALILCSVFPTGLPPRRL